MKGTAWTIIVIILALVVAALVIIFALKGFHTGKNETIGLWNLTNVSG